ncbi:MAG: MFS transporter [Nitrospinae bacterium]|nr:MFS transporter [Nitrospinota bacterium]
MNRETRIVAASSVAHFLTHMFTLIFPAIVMPFARDMGVPAAAVYPLGFYQYFLYGALALPAGYVADHWSRAGMLKIAVAGMSGAALLAALAPNAATFTAALALIGLCCGLYHPAGLGLIAHEIPKQGSAHGINGVFGNLGIAAAPLFAGLVLLTMEWRWVYALAAAMGLAGFIAIVALDVEESHRGETAAAPSPPDSINGAWKYFLILLAAMTVAGFVYRANTTALPSYLERSAAGLVALLEPLRGMGASAEDARSGAAAILAGGLYFFSMAAQLIGGKIADRADLRRAYLMFHAASVPFALAMAYLVDLPLYLAAAGMVFFSLGMQPVANSMVSTLLHRRWLSTGYGIKFTFTFGLGSVAVWQVGWFDREYGLPALYLALAGEAALIALIAAGLWFATRKIARVANH